MLHDLDLLRYNFLIKLFFFFILGEGSDIAVVIIAYHYSTLFNLCLTWN